MKRSRSGCVQNDYIQVRVPAKSNYEAVWYSEVGEGTRWWTPPATRYPKKVVGEGDSYLPPLGWSAWSAAGGAGYCPGTAPSGTFGTAGWAVVGCTLPRIAPTTTDPGSPSMPAESGSAAPGQPPVIGQIVSAIQVKVLQVTQGVTCHKSKKGSTASRMFHKYLRRGKLTTTVKVPGPLHSPVSVNLTITGQSSQAHAPTTAAQALVTVTRSGTLALSLPLTSSGSALLRDWLSGGRVDLTVLATPYDPAGGWPAPPSSFAAGKSTTFAGYEYANYVAIPESVTASFVVPKLACQRGDAQAIYPEVGVESNTSTAGLLMGCDGTRAWYWPSVTVDNVLKSYPGDAARPGDTIELSVTQSFSATTASVVDTTHAFEARQTGAGGGTGVDLQVGLTAWNDPEPLPVPGFDRVTFSKALLNGAALGSSKWSASLDRFNDYASSDPSSVLQMATSQITSDHESFTVDFKHS